MDNVIDNFLSDCGFFVFLPHFADFRQCFFHLLRMTVGYGVDFYENKTVVGFYRLRNFALIIGKNSIDKIVVGQQTGMRSRQRSRIACFVEAFDAIGGKSHLSGNFIQRRTGADFIFNLINQVISRFVNFFFCQGLGNCFSGFGFILFGTGFDIGDFHKVPAEIRLQGTDGFVVLGSKNRTAGFADQHIFGNVFEVGFFIGLTGFFPSNLIKIFSGVKSLLGGCGILFRRKNHLQNVTGFRRNKLVEVFFIILVDFFFADDGMSGNVVY